MHASTANNVHRLKRPPHARPPLALHGSPPRPRRALAAAALLTAVAASAFAAGAAVHRFAPRNHAQKPAPPAVRPCETAIVTRGAISGILTVPGRLAFERVVRVGSTLGGQITAVGPAAGERVEAGEVLARLDDLEQRSAVATARARLTSAGLLALRADRQLEDRWRGLDEDALVDDAQLELAHAVAEVGKERSAIARARGLLERRTIRAPLAGVVLERSIEAGESVAASPPGPPLFTIASDPARLTIELAIDERHVAEVRPGPVTFTVPAARPQRTFEATVRQVSLAPVPASAVSPPEAGGSAPYRALLEVPNPDGTLRPGMSVLVDVPMVSLTGALHVPSGALRSPPDGAGGGGGTVIWLAGDGGRPIPTPVHVGVADGELAEVEGAGVASGRVVVTDGSPATCVVPPPISPFAGGNP